MKHLVIPDTHVKPGQDLSRFEWLGQFIMDERPDKIICLGDFADMESLCSYDVGKKDYNSRNYREDIDAAVEAQSILFGPLNSYNHKKRRNRKKQYNPELHMLLGNHENRINRAISLDHVVLEGLISIEDLQFETFGWKVHPFLDVVKIDGIHYSHYFVSGVMGRPISGEHPAASLLSKHHVSCTAGHLHVLDASRRTRADGHPIRGLVAGCYFEHNEGYAGPANKLWWKGVFIKENVNNGDYDLKEYSLEELKRRYA